MPGLAGGAGERRGHGDHAGTAYREDPVELGEADVVTDTQAQPGAVGELGDHDLVARLLAVGFAVLLAADGDVEHVDLPVHGLPLTVGAEVQRGVGQLVVVLAALDDRAGHEVDPQLARGVARPARGRAVKRLGAALERVVLSEHVPLLRENDQIRAVGSGLAGEAVGSLQVCGTVLS